MIPDEKDSVDKVLPAGIASFILEGLAFFYLLADFLVEDLLYFLGEVTGVYNKSDDFGTLKFIFNYQYQLEF